MDVISTESNALAEAGTVEGKRRWRRALTRRALVYAVLPALAMVLALGAGYLKWVDGSAREAQPASVEAVNAAIEVTTKMLSYQPNTVGNDLAAAGQKMTGAFRDS
jgi:Mce-associated membrane protein